MQQFTLLSLSLLSLAGSSLACNVVNGVKFTAYGFPDANGTPAYKCRGNQVVPTQAGDRTELGDGSFGNPYAAAAAGNSVFKKCELLYHPLLKKYFRVQDDCSGCVSKQTDLYIAQYNRDVGQLSCEQAFGTFNYGKPLHEVIRNPGSGFATDTRPLFTPGHCYNKASEGRVFPGRDGKVKCGNNGAQVETAEDQDGGADQVDEPSPLDTKPADRHASMKGKGASSTKTEKKAVPTATATGKAFEA